MQKDDTYSYKGWLNSDYFIKRVAGVFLYGLLAQLLITIAIFAFFMVLGMMMLPFMFAGNL